MVNSGTVLEQRQAVRAKEPGSKRPRLWRLEAVRGLAALYVVCHHTSSNYLKLKGTIWGFPFRFGLEAVLIFFILSGFVICYSHQNAAGECESFKNYFIKRTRRIYPIFILSLIFAYVIACVGVGGWAALNVRQLFGNLFMLQNHWAHPKILCAPFADNMPLWSLSFEWWFYMMFYPINRWVPRSAQKYLVLALGVVGFVAYQLHPNGASWFLTFFIIWWVGVELAHEFRATGDVSLARQKIMFGLLAVPLIWYGVVTWLWRRHGGILHLNTYPVFDLRYFLGALVLLGLVLVWRQFRFAGFDSTIGRFERLGAISYALYVFHYPILIDLRLLSGSRLFYVDLVLRYCLIFFLAWLAEGVLQKWINRVTAPLLQSAKA